MAGATAASKDVATQEVREAYNSLKQLIATRFKRKAVVEAVEEAPDSASAHEALGGALKEIGADRDSEVRKLAAQLAAALEALGSGVLRRANIKIGDVEGCRDAIVRGLSAADNVTVDKVKAEKRDAIVEHIDAGAPLSERQENPPPKNRGEPASKKGQGRTAMPQRLCQESVASFRSCASAFKRPAAMRYPLLSSSSRTSAKIWQMIGPR